MSSVNSHVSLFSLFFISFLNQKWHERPFLSDGFEVAYGRTVVYKVLGHWRTYGLQLGVIWEAL